MVRVESLRQRGARRQKMNIQHRRLSGDYREVAAVIRPPKWRGRRSLKRERARLERRLGKALCET
jgi:hypothetical protein